MKNDRPCVLVYNPISGHGHLDSWNAMFVALLLERGWRVLALTPDEPALMSRLAQKGIVASPRLQVLDWNAHTSRLKVFLQSVWRRWDAFGDKFYYRRPGSEATPDMTFLMYWKTQFFQAVVPFLFRASYFLYTHYRRSVAPANVATGGIDLERDLADPMELALRTRAALKKAKWKPALGFNMYMDTYRTRPESWDTFDALNQLPWAGIRFVPTDTLREAWYALPSFRGMCFLDENVCRIYREALPGKHFAYLPDITETGLPDTPGELAREIRHRAAGRKIVFLGGSIGGQKNLARWYELIGLADPAQWFFVQIGEIHRGTLTAEDLAALDLALDAPPENLMLHAEYLPDERAFNEIIAASDILFAVYRDFRISSNMLGKAAHFRKPLLASDRYLMGERITRYGVGRAVSEDNAARMLNGLSIIASDPIPAENFARYCVDFSTRALAEHLDCFLSKCLKLEVL